MAKIGLSTAILLSAMMSAVLGSTCKFGETRWFGSAVFCSGNCPDGWRFLRESSAGDGYTCWTGTKKECVCTTLSVCEEFWAGSAPVCQQSCPQGYTEIRRDAYGDGNFCLFGSKVLCSKCPTTTTSSLINKLISKPA